MKDFILKANEDFIEDIDYKKSSKKNVPVKLAYTSS